MTNDWFLDCYGEEEVTFDFYWKYSFSFSNSNVLVTIGGVSDDIYRLDVNRKPIKVKDLLLGWDDFDYELKSAEVLK